MKKTILLLLVVITSFCSGYVFKTIIEKPRVEPSALKRVTSIGGIFFKCKEPAKIREWYKVHLGLTADKYGAVFEWRQAVDSSKKGFTQWSPFNEKSKYFEPSTKDFMINYRVADLPALLVELQKEGVTIADTMQTAEYGKFVHIMDIEGNKIELWEPNDLEYEKLGVQMGSKTVK